MGYTVSEIVACACVVLVLLSAQVRGGCLSDESFYNETCPIAMQRVFQVMKEAVNQEQRMAASILRLHFHDCFVNGCDGSVLLDATSSFASEKAALPNINSLRGFDVVDNIKTALEKECSQIVSCADILAIAARDAIVLSGGPYYKVQLGRRDATTANQTAANVFIPNPQSDVSQLTSSFQAVGLSKHDLVALSGAHTIGKARCLTIARRINNQTGNGKPDATIEPSFLSQLQQICPQNGDQSVTLPLDAVTASQWDNQYYKNLQARKGLLNSDEVLYTSTGRSVNQVEKYINNQNKFFKDFVTSILKMGAISPLTGEQGQIRANCRVVNPAKLDRA